MSGHGMRSRERVESTMGGAEPEVGRTSNSSIKSQQPEEEEEEVIVTRSQWQDRCAEGVQIGRKRPNRLASGWTLAIGLVLLATLADAQTEPSSAPTTRTANETTTLAPVDTSLEPTSAPSSAGQQHKLKPINFTLVDELFESTVNETDLLRRWKNMDGQFQEGIRSILKLVFPQIVAISQDAKVSGDCSGGILKWILSLRNLRSWAIKMLDATGKPTAGIFEGSLTMFGNHRQCLSIRAPDEDEIEITDQFEEYFRGQFCVLHLRPWLSAKKPFYHLNSTIEPLLRKSYKYYEKTLYDELAEIAIAFNFIDIRMDLCVPSTCTTADIQRVADLLSRKLEMKAKVMRCDIESRESAATFVQNLDQTTTIWLIAPVGLVLITLLSTVLVLLRGTSRADDNYLASQSLSADRLLYSLSLQGALNHLFSVPRFAQTHTSAVGQTVDLANSNQSQPYTKPVPLYGLRNLFIVWFVIVQLTVELKYQYLRESLVLRNMILAYWPFQIIINTSMIFESLILITAFTYGYTNLHTTTRGLLAYIGAKYIRLVPSIATLVTITIVLPSIGITSPVWKNFVEAQSSVCKSTGYLDLFFLQNFVSYDKICLPHTWLFCVELQLIALSIPLVLLLQRAFKSNEDLTIITQGDLASKSGCNRRRLTESKPIRLAHLLLSKAGLVGVALVLAGAAGNFALVYTNQLPPAWFHTFPDAAQKDYYFSTYLTKAWTHLTTFVVGLYAGYLARASVRLSPIDSADSSSLGAQSARDSGKSLAGNSRTIWRVSFQLAACVCLASTVFLTSSWSTRELPSPLVSAAYDSLARLVWSLALAGLMVQLCRPSPDGAYSRLARLFSHPVCAVLGRLSFLAYLTAPLVHTFILAVQEQALFPSLYLIFHVILGNLVITYLLAFVLSLMIEQPIRLAVRQLGCVALKTSGCATISTTNPIVTTTTSTASLAG